MKKNNMSFILVIKKMSFLFLLIFAAFFSASFAGRLHRSMVSKEVSITSEEVKSLEPVRHDGVISVIHERRLKVKTNDYGHYDPAPAFVKPPFKLIPN